MIFQKEVIARALFEC